MSNFLRVSKSVSLKKGPVDTIRLSMSVFLVVSNIRNEKKWMKTSFIEKLQRNRSYTCI